MSFDLASRVKGPKAPDRAILALFSSCVAKFCNASHGVALNLDIWREHLADQRRQATELDNKHLVLSVDGEIAKGRTGSSLDLDIGALQQKQDGLQSIAIDLADISFCDFGKRQTGAAL